MNSALHTFFDKVNLPNYGLFADDHMIWRNYVEKRKKTLDTSESPETQLAKPSQAKA